MVMATVATAIWPRNPLERNTREKQHKPITAAETKLIATKIKPLERENKEKKTIHFCCLLLSF